MENSNSYNTDLYLMLAPNLDALKVKKCARGTEGFEAFVKQNAQEFLSNPFIPDYWLFHYQLSLKQEHMLAPPKNRDYFRKLLPSLKKECIHPAGIQTLRSACQDIQSINPRKLRDLMMLGEKTEDDLFLVLPPFASWRVVGTHQGVLLFSNTLRANRLLAQYLQYQANHFFHPQMPQSELTIGLLPKFDRSLSSLVDRCPNINPIIEDDGASLLLPPAVFAPDTVLKDAFIAFRYDMFPSWENYVRFTLPQSETGLYSTECNKKIAFLLSLTDGDDSTMNPSGSLLKMYCKDLCLTQTDAQRMLNELGPIRHAKEPTVAGKLHQRL